MGGEEDWTYEYLEPVPGENDLMKDTATRDKILSARESLFADFEKLTQKWIDSGVDEGAQLRPQRHELATALRNNYWKLDPYVRARSIYDRSGMMAKSEIQSSERGTESVAKTESVSAGHADDVD